MGLSEPRCRECGTRRPSAFYDYLATLCKACKTAQQRARYRRHPGPPATHPTVTCSTCGAEFSRKTINAHRKRCAVNRRGSTRVLECPCGRIHQLYSDRRACPAFQCDTGPDARQEPTP